MPTAIEWCKARRACTEALNWIETLPEDATMHDAWMSCERGDWMLWAISRCEHVEEYREAIKEIVNGIADRAVRTVLSAIEGIDEAWAQQWRSWATGWLSGEERSTTAARGAAWAAWAAAGAAADAAEAAAEASWAAAVPAAVWAADAATRAKADAAARAASPGEELLRQADDIREVIPDWPEEVTP